MAMTLDELKALAIGAGYRIFVDPEKPVVFIPIKGASGTFNFAMIIEGEGQFLQFRTTDLLRCPPDHPHVALVHSILAMLNMDWRFVKFGWDRRDGEIVAAGDAWIMDGQLTRKQFEQMVGNFLPVVDSSVVRIRRAMETGQDPGPVQPTAAPTPPTPPAGSGVVL